MLEGRRLENDGLKAGLTSSPDFFRTIVAFTRASSSSSSGSLESVSLPSLVPLRSSSKAEPSVEDREWEIFRASLDRGGCDKLRVLDCSSDASFKGTTSPRAILVFRATSLTRFGELSRCCSMIRIAACSSARFSSCRPFLLRELSSSSLEF